VSFPDKPLKLLERVKGIEPSSSAWKAVALPLSYTRKKAVAAPCLRQPPSSNADFSDRGSGRQPSR
jgi:hypothetical protein